MVAAPVESPSPVVYPETKADFLASPFKSVDDRLVQWELGREGMNGDGRDELVVPYSSSFSGAGGATPQWCRWVAQNKPRPCAFTC